MKYKYLGNSYLESGKVTSAIDAYNKALSACTHSKQEGVILLLRASAYLQQAQTHKEILQKAVNEWKLPSPDIFRAMLQDASSMSGFSDQTAVSLSFLRKLKTNGSIRTAQLRKIKYRHGLYQNSLLQAAQDSLRATELLPDYSTSWLRAGELLSDLWRIKESRQYYEKAVSLDGSLADSVDPIMQVLEQREELLDRAQSNKEWQEQEDSVRLALDVAG